MDNNLKMDGVYKSSAGVCVKDLRHNRFLLVSSHIILVDADVFSGIALFFYANQAIVLFYIGIRLCREVKILFLDDCFNKILTLAHYICPNQPRNVCVTQNQCFATSLYPAEA